MKRDTKILFFAKHLSCIYYFSKMEIYGIFICVKKCIIGGFLFFSAWTSFAQSINKLSLSDAIILAVENNYDIQKQRYALAAARGEYRQAIGALDVEVGASAGYSMKQNPVDEKDPRYMYSYSLLSPRTSYGVYSDNTTSHQTQGELFAQKLFSFGLQTKLSYTLQRTHDFPHYIYGSTFDTTQYSKYAQERGRNTGIAMLEMSLPLFKSFKNSLANLQIKAAQENLTAMEAELRNTVSKAIIDVNKQFWNYYTTYKTLERLEVLQKKIEERLERMEPLIKAGARSQNDLLALQVNVNENRRQMQDAKVQYQQAKTELMTALGLTDYSMIGEPTEPFPAGELRAVVPPDESSLTNEFYTTIEENRSDLASLRKRAEAMQFKAKMADADRLPDAALNFGIGTTGVTYSDEFLKGISAGFWNNAGLNITGALSFSAKIGNNAKTGAYDQAQAEYLKSLSDYGKAKNTLILQIHNAVDKLAIYRSEFAGADEVLDLNKKLYDNEEQRFNVGLITVDTLLQQDQKYIAAENSYYQVLTNYLQAILEYKYYTATLVDVDTTTAFEAKDLYINPTENTTPESDTAEVTTTENKPSAENVDE